jgi:GNAT superfamily N-acetyltransferase
VQVAAWEGEFPVGRGMVLFATHPEYSASAAREGCAEVRDVFVSAGRRRRGIASRVMAALEAAATARRFPLVGLAVALDPDAVPARALYERLGYRAAHGPFVSSTDLNADDGPMPVAAVLTYLVKEL